MHHSAPGTSECSPPARRHAGPAAVTGHPQAARASATMQRQTARRQPSARVLRRGPAAAASGATAGRCMQARAVSGSGPGGRRVTGRVFGGGATSSAQLRWPLVDVRPLKRYCSSSRSWLPLAGSAPALPLLPPREDHCCARRAACRHSVLRASHGRRSLAGINAPRLPWQTQRGSASLTHWTLHLGLLCRARVQQAGAGRHVHAQIQGRYMV